MIGKFKLPAKILISVIILWVLLSRMNMSSLEHSLHEISWSAWAWATLLVIVQAILISARWALLVNVHKKTISMIESVRITALSSIANLVFITSVGGIVVRAALAVRHGLSLSKAILATFIDRLFTLLGLLIITALLYSFLKSYIPFDIYRATGFFLIGLILCGLMAVPLLFRAPYNNKFFVRRRFAPLASYTRHVFNNPAIMTQATALSVGAQIAYLFSSYVIILSSGIDVPFWPTIALLPILALISSMPIGFGGWGIREGTFVYGLGLVGVPIETAFLISVQIGIVGILATIALGAIVLLTTEDFKVAHYKSLLLKKAH